MSPFLQIIKEAINKAKKIETKSSPNDLVTETDKCVENLLMKTIATNFPSHK